MSCQDNVECLKAAIPVLCKLIIAIGAMTALILSMLGFMPKMESHINELIATIMIIAEVHNDEH